jgi:hypothetical protein
MRIENDTQTTSAYQNQAIETSGFRNDCVQAGRLQNIERTHGVLLLPPKKKSQEKSKSLSRVISERKTCHFWICAARQFSL